MPNTTKLIGGALIIGGIVAIYMGYKKVKA